MSQNIDLQTIYKIVGNNISYLRKKRNLTQEELACSLNIHSQSLISQYERAKKQLTLEKITDFCQFFDVSLSKMLFSDLSGEEKNNNQIDATSEITSGPIKKCANRTYYGYYLKEQNGGKSNFLVGLANFEIDILNATSSHEAPVELYLDGRDKPCINGTIHMDETYAYIMCHDWEKDWFWHLTFYYHRKRQSLHYQGGMAMLQTLDYHLLPICQLCIISINAISAKHRISLQDKLKIDAKAKGKLSSRELSSSAILRLTKEKDRNIYMWLTENVKI